MQYSLGVRLDQPDSHCILVADAAKPHRYQYSLRIILVKPDCHGILVG